ncbi:hypothetical protein AK812_SmicGene41407 [Symbiodinium microadriaticum]|uniref:Uncharacterized protein n=1 Tax=Symbiodinium microadriaticum TaxID=2951 RepID=A0A1Q9C656_SYMMI|nr:hypothetical protein AK812_SmicGene41407 [Symbiodinium microadriaticum]
MLFTAIPSQLYCQDLTLDTLMDSMTSDLLDLYENGLQVKFKEQSLRFKFVLLAVKGDEPPAPFLRLPTIAYDRGAVKPDVAHTYAIVGWGKDLAASSLILLYRLRVFPGQAPIHGGTPLTGVKVSSGHYGLAEANMMEELRVPDIRLVQDMKIRTLHRGHNIEELEAKLAPQRKEPGTTEEEKKQHVAESHFYVASPEEASGFLERVKSLIDDPQHRKAMGLEAKRRAEEFVKSRRGEFLTQLAQLAREKLAPRA